MPVASVPYTTLPMEMWYSYNEKGLRPQKRRKEGNLTRKKSGSVTRKESGVWNE